MECMYFCDSKRIIKIMDEIRANELAKGANNDDFVKDVMDTMIACKTIIAFVNRDEDNPKASEEDTRKFDQETLEFALKQSKNYKIKDDK